MCSNLRANKRRKIPLFFTFSHLKTQYLQWFFHPAGQNAWYLRCFHSRTSITIQHVSRLHMQKHGIYGVFATFRHTNTEKTSKSTCFSCFHSQKHGIYDVLPTCRLKTQEKTLDFWPCFTLSSSKNIGIWWYLRCFFQLLTQSESKSASAGAEQGGIEAPPSPNCRMVHNPSTRTL